MGKFLRNKQTDKPTNSQTESNSYRVSLFEFLKGNMMHERKRDDELLNILKQQIEYLKGELRFKNNLIEKLMNNFKSLKHDINASRNNSSSINNNNNSNSTFIDDKFRINQSQQIF